jgi:hypothetical protein
MARPNFIPVELREQLRADSEQAKKNGDAHCAECLRKLSEYPGYNAPLRVRELGLQACELRYASAKELMQLVRFAEAEEARS